MNRINALLDQSDYSAEYEYMNYNVDGRWLDELLDDYLPESTTIGLIPTLLFELQSESEQSVVWTRILPAINTKTNCPILMCSDDADFSCNIIIAEIENCGSFVRWNRIGSNRTDNYVHEDIGTKVEWFEKVPPFTFEKNEYLKMLWAFKTQFLFAHHENLVRLRSEADTVSFNYFKSRKLPFYSTIDSFPKKNDYLVSNGWEQNNGVYVKHGFEFFWDNSTALEIYNTGNPKRRIEDARIETVEELHHLVQRYEKKHRESVIESLRARGWRVMNRLERMKDNGTPIEEGEDPDDVVFISVSGRKDFTDEFTEKISCLTELISLHVDGTAITDNGVVHFCKLKKLKYLNLRKTNITDKCVRAISMLPELHTLWLNGTKVQGNTLSDLEKNHKLEQLFLCESKITDAQTPQLARLSSLNYLSIGSTDVSSKSFQVFRKMTNLRTLLIENTHVTEEEGNQLHAECPNIRVDTYFY